MLCSNSIILQIMCTIKKTLILVYQVLEVWIQLMWHFRPENADWSILNTYFSQMLDRNDLGDYIFNRTTYPVGWADVEKVCIQNQAIIVHLVCAGHDGLGFRQPTLL